MSQTISGDRTAATRTSAPSPWGQSIRWGLGALVVGAAVAVYGAYGDPHPQAEQENTVPFVCGVLAVVAAVAFGALVPAALRGIAARTGRWSGWALAIGILALVATPIAFWSGVPVVLGTAGALIAAAGRRVATTGRGLATAALTVNVLAVVACLALVVLGNTVLS